MFTIKTQLQGHNIVSGVNGSEARVAVGNDNKTIVLIDKSDIRKIVNSVNSDGKESLFAIIVDKPCYKSFNKGKMTDQITGFVNSVINDRVQDYIKPQLNQYLEVLQRACPQSSQIIEAARFAHSDDFSYFLFSQYTDSFVTLPFSFNPASLNMNYQVYIMSMKIFEHTAATSDTEYRIHDIEEYDTSEVVLKLAEYIVDEDAFIELLELQKKLSEQ